MIYDAKGNRITELRPASFAGGASVEFLWEAKGPGKGFQKGVYYLLLKARGGQFSQTVTLGFP